MVITSLIKHCIDPYRDLTEFPINDIINNIKAKKNIITKYQRNSNDRARESKIHRAW